MTKNHKREIIQLWWAADQYFGLAEQTKKNLKKNDLKTNVQGLANKCQHMSDIKDVNEQLMLLNAHLGSCAVRLYSIDELLGKHYTSTRWFLYVGLEAKKNNLKKDDIMVYSDKIVHILLRHNVAHEEELAEKKAEHKTMQDALQDVEIGRLYESMRLVRGEIGTELKKGSII